MTQAFVLRNRIQEIRTARGMTEKQLGDIVDATEDAIMDFEKGKFIPSARMAMAMCLAMNCKFEDLFYAEDPVDTSRQYNDFRLH